MVQNFIPGARMLTFLRQNCLFTGSFKENTLLKRFSPHNAMPCGKKGPYFRDQIPILYYSVWMMNEAKRIKQGWQHTNHCDQGNTLQAYYVHMITYLRNLQGVYKWQTGRWISVFSQQTRDKCAACLIWYWPTMLWITQLTLFQVNISPVRGNSMVRSPFGWNSMLLPQNFTWFI